MTRRKDLNLILQLIDQSINRSSPSPYRIMKGERREKEGRRKRKRKPMMKIVRYKYNSPSQLNPCTIARVSVVRRWGGGRKTIHSLTHSLKGSISF